MEFLLYCAVFKKKKVFVENAVAGQVRSVPQLVGSSGDTLQGALKDGFREAVLAHDMPEPC